MPSRKQKHVERFETPEVQPPDGYIVVRHFNWGSAREYRALGGDEEGKALSPEFRDMLASQILEWNWVDDAGSPLPQPKDDPTVLDRLLTSEMTVVSVCVRGIKYKVVDDEIVLDVKGDEEQEKN